VKLAATDLRRRDAYSNVATFAVLYKFPKLSPRTVIEVRLILQASREWLFYKYLETKVGAKSI